ncbi:extracellular solute-binding protein [Leptolyngbya sp. NIES-2104]|uniref:extracellular solute-binding protein n=1 Tax=Leptolyngbya sp. NIES-2104 TaxID=1552121 RepID=UPI0006EC5E71|nr:extracellular solute-binding protein [Leptolyngbya sp. NIES-2104]GAP98260.1 ABC transporter, periplasmic spermidine putrescine-binding protein PotD [Leptolyngbya sp. NIES-2104]
MDRRSFLLGIAALSTTLTGCNSPDQKAFRVRLLKNSIPLQFPNEFRKQLTEFKETSIDIKPADQLQTLFTALQGWKRQGGKPEPDRSFNLPFVSQPATIPDLVTMGDYWLSVAIRQQLIQPLDPKTWQLWNQLPDLWKKLVTRENQVWGAPYRWGATVIVYRTDIFRDRNLTPPKDWADLWREDLRGRIGLLDQPREIIGLTLKKLGQSYNTANLTIPTLEAELTALNRQTKFYSSDSVLQSLLVDDIWMAVAWSTDVLQAMKRNPSIAAIFPSSGTALFTDLWVRPAVVPNQDKAAQSLVGQWINFCWQPSIAPQFSLLSQGASPILSTLDPATLPDQLRENALLVPPAQSLDRSEFLEPISDTTLEQYRSLWTKIRSSV